MMSAITIDNYWGVGTSIILLVLSSFWLGFISGYDARIRDARRDLMSREWCCRSCDIYDEDDVQEGLCSDCFSAMPEGEWVSANQLREIAMRNHPTNNGDQQ